MIVWRRLDTRGHEACRIVGETLEGAAVLTDPPSALTYRVVCDEGWRTRFARVTGFIGPRTIDLTFEPLPGCVDVDLNFSPSTNTLPIRRLGLAIGESASLTVAWLRFPEMTLEPLAQTYRRVAERTWEYASDGFTARMEVDAEGLVTSYEGLWVKT
ncbi:MAG TPA: putative glycolipid-binding domain-containing protein [Thermoanaerobaculia bacterium]|nr:putative glycolipid-binding domain-containing protein [Thermoanaerobaculia bacterium]